MNKQEAEETASRYLAPPRFGPLEIVITQTVEKEYGWIFRYQRRDYVEGKSKHGLIGNGPVLVEKSGNIVQFASSKPWEESVRRYEAGLPLFSIRKRQEAEEAASTYLAHKFALTEMAVLPDSTIEKSYGWIVCYRSKDQLEESAKQHEVSIGSVLVEKRGEIVDFPSPLSVEEAIRRYEADEPLDSSGETQAG
jgi:Immunity protein 35